MAAFSVLLMCWLFSVSRANFYYDCENMNCSCALRMRNSLGDLEKRLDSVQVLRSSIRDSADDAAKSVKFDDLRMRIISVNNTVDKLTVSKSMQSINRQRTNSLEIEKSLVRVTEFLEIDVQRNRAELTTLITQSNEKGKKLQKALLQIRNRLNRLRQDDSSRSVATLNSLQEMGQLEKDAMKRSEYNRDSSELLNKSIDIRLDVLLSGVRHLNFAPEISRLNNSRELNFLKVRETDLNSSLEAIRRQRIALLNKVRELTAKIEENGRLIDRLHKQAIGNTKISKRT